MALLDQFSAATSMTLQGRVEVALVTAATNVMAEATTTPNHANRVLYAHAVLHNPQQEALNMTMAVVTNSTVATELGNIPDGDIQFAVNSFFNAFSN